MIDGSGLEPAFAGLPTHLLQRIRVLAVPCRFVANEILFRTGDRPDGLYIILDGQVRVSREARNHVELLHTETVGGLLGEIPVFGKVAFPATAVAIEATRCAKLPIAAVDALLHESPEFARFALARLAMRAHSLLRRIDELTAMTVTARVAQFLLSRAKGERDFTLGASQAAVAAELGTAREVVVRSIAALVRAGAIRRVGRSRFAIVSLPAMHAIAGGESSV